MTNRDEVDVGVKNVKGIVGGATICGIVARS